jgi:lipoprotein-releasing system permease protein
LGIGTGVLALTVIIAVMNGFQLGFIESILEVSSFHIRVENFSAPADGVFEERLLRLPGVSSALPFRELQGMIRGSRGTLQAAVIRGLPVDAPERDPGLAARLEFERGGFDMASPDSILLGSELAQRLGLRIGDELTLISLSGLFPEDAAAGESRFVLTGTFRTGFYEYDLGWGFVRLERAAELGGAEKPPVLGIKLKNRWQDGRALGEIAALLAGEPGGAETGLSSWRDYNRAFFGALRTEKLLMFTLVGLIFIVVGLNIFQAQRRTVLERREEIGLLRALGAPDFAVRLVFVWDGFIIGLAGAGGGMILGLLTASHIPGFFGLLEGLVNFFIGLANNISDLLGGPGAEEFALFSPRVFYIKEIPSRLIPHEVLLIFMFGFMSALLAAWFASGKVSRTRPSEVLRYE